MHKYTFTLDAAAAGELERAAERLGIAKSQVVREALRLYGEHLGRLDADERARMLATFDEVTAAIPDRPREEVVAELDEVRQARAEARGTEDPGAEAAGGRRRDS